MSFQKVINNSFFTNLFGTLEKSSTVKDFFKNYFITPINNGLIGFAIVFTAIIFIRLFDRLFLTHELKYVNMDDLANASIGLLVFGLGRIIVNFIYSITKSSQTKNTPNKTLN